MAKNGYVSKPSLAPIKNLHFSAFCDLSSIPCLTTNKTWYCQASKTTTTTDRITKLPTDKHCLCSAYIWFIWV